MGLLEGIASLFGGGLTGLLGAALQKLADYKTEQLRAETAKDQRAHEIALKDADAKIMAQEWAGRTKIAETEASGKEAVADSQAFAASSSPSATQTASSPRKRKRGSW